MSWTDKLFLTNRVRHIAIWMGWEILFAVWYVASLGDLSADTPLLSGAVMGLLINVIIMAVVSATILAIALRYLLPPEPMDERDRFIEALSFRDGFIAVLVSIIALIAYLIIGNPGAQDGSQALIPFTPLAITHALMGVIFFGDTFRRIALLVRNAAGA